MKSKLVVAIIALLFIVACGTTYLAYNSYQQKNIKLSNVVQEQDENEKVSLPEETEQMNNQEEQQTVGFDMAGERVEKAIGVPADQEKAILAAFDEYIAAFNEKDLERYKKVISKNAQSFTYEDDIQAVTEVFKQYQINREVDDVTIVNYQEQEAQVFSNVKTEAKEIKTGMELATVGRQITGFMKEENDWKVTSVHYLENDNSKVQVNKYEVYDFMERKFASMTNGGETYIAEIHDPLVAKAAAEYFGITQEEADAMYIEVAMNLYK